MDTVTGMSSPFFFHWSKKAPRWRLPGVIHMPMVSLLSMHRRWMVTSVSLLKGLWPAMRPMVT